MTETQNLDVLLKPEEDDYDEKDTETINDSTVSISSSILKYREENGRTYHAYKDGAYLFPNDDTEKDRLDLQHHQWTVTFGGKLYQAPIPSDQASYRVLDIGTGTGIWAIDFAEEHPESEVVGVDLSPIQPGYVPQNVSFQVDDCEADWTFTTKFDFIYSRMMVGAFSNPEKFIRQSFENLVPGGYLEMADLSYPLKCLGDKWPEDSALKKWSELCMEAGAKVGRNGDFAHGYKRQMEEAGFVDIVERKYVWPSNRWPKDKHLKEIGTWQLENLGGGLDGISYALFTRALGWKKEDVDVFLIKVKAELKSTKVHTYWDIFNVYGRKPESK